MKLNLLLALLLFPICINAQERFTIRGRIINPQGEPIEYVQIGIPESNIGTISGVDGRFEIVVPAGTLEFFHVSYKPASYSVSGPADGLVIVLDEQELPPAVFIGGDTKEKYLLRPGAKVAAGHARGAISLRSEQDLGRELGSLAQVNKPFLVKDILLSITSNGIPECVASVNIYRIEGKKESFVNVLNKPLYFSVAVSEDQQDFDIRPDETILLEPGRYFVAFQIVGCSKEAMQAFLAKPEADRKFWEMTMYFKLYFKSSYLRETALGEMKHYPFNIGIAVKGLEYQ